MGEAGDGGRLYEAGDEGGADNHPGETPQLDWIQLETCSKKDHGQAEGAKASRQDWIQLVANVARVAIAWECTRGIGRSRERLKVIRIVEIVQRVNKGGIQSRLSALGAAKLSDVVRDVLEEDPNDKHPKERRQGHGDARNATEQIPQQLDKVTTWYG